MFKCSHCLRQVSFDIYVNLKVTIVYLGSVMSVNGGTEGDVASRIKKENGVFVQLYPACMEISQHIKRS
jgi:hypothetical protein